MSAAAVEGLDADQAVLAEIAENLHRADLTPLERNEHIAEWIRLTEAKDKPSQVGTVWKGGRGNAGGVNAAARELGVSKSAAHRAVKVAAITPEAKKAAVDAGLKAQADLEKIASYSDADQVEAVAKIVAEKEARKAETRVKIVDDAEKVSAKTGVKQTTENRRTAMYNDVDEPRERFSSGAPVFDWNDNEAIVVKRRDALAVYANSNGRIAIRMQADALEDEDHVVWFPLEDAQAVIDGILQVKKEIEAE